MKIAFAGTPEFAYVQLKALLDTSHEIVVVYTQPDRHAGRGQHLQASPVKELALAHQIAVEQPISLKPAEEINKLKSYHPDVLIVAAYGLLLPESILQAPTYGCINVHVSLLPRWRGASPIQQAILAGDAQTGVTLMRMDKGLDTGNILVQRACPINSDDTAGTLHDKLAQLGAQLLTETLAEIITQPGRSQDPTQATHSGKISKEQGHLDWHLPAAVLEKQIRAFNPWPVAYTFLNQEVLRIWRAKVIPSFVKAAPGTIIEHLTEGPVIATGQDALLLLEGQLPGKKRLAFSEIRRGHPSLFMTGQQLS